ncbi:response regulator with CheY-like receiver [Idiomarina sp. A28L]|uniref:response regulator n=1 Tax=Idiomarina sp. A28L TaxID=1036674 RepID=UPI00021388E4|nr:response regulator [Idiomarina sp. A28L]EGN76183.1 response regulator with CheY-like receiver [Idiomarina sp. A28L]
MTKLERVLVVDDEQDIQAIAKLSLERVGGLETLICSSGREAIDKVQVFAPNIILLDVMMPGLDGPATLSILKEKGLVTNIPVVFFTAKVLDKEIEELHSCGAFDVISKPFDPMKLPSILEDIWRRSQ